MAISGFMMKEVEVEGRKSKASDSRADWRSLWYGVRLSTASAQLKLCTSDCTIRCQPSTRTKSSSLNGSETTLGGIIIMPSDISTAETRKSMTRKGRKSKNPIWKADCSSLSTNDGMTT